MARTNSTNSFGLPVNWKARARFFEWASRQTVAALRHEHANYCAGSVWKAVALLQIIEARTNDEERAKVARANQAALAALMPEEVSDEAC